MEKIFVVSDGTGRTAEQVLKAALTQFPNSSVEIIMKQEIRTGEQLEELMQEVIASRGFILHTLVSETLREEISRLSRIHNVESMDLMGPLLFRLTQSDSHQVPFRQFTLPIDTRSIAGYAAATGEIFTSVKYATV